MSGFDWIRIVPLVISAALFGLVVWLWPEQPAQSDFLVWANEAILVVFSLLSFSYGLRLMRERAEPRAGSRLRAKLVIGLVAMLMLPAMVIQVAANQMVEKGMDVWFDLRVDTLLDRALELAQGFYERIEKDMKRNMLGYISDPLLIAAVQDDVSFAEVNARLVQILYHEGWERIQLFDINERLVASVQARGLGSVQAEPLSDAAKLAMQLGHLATEIVAWQGGEKLMGYAPIRGRQGAAGLLRVEIQLPAGVIQSARGVEADYRNYRELEKNRQSLQFLFTHLMLFVTLLVVLLAGMVGLAFARRLTSPIGELAQALRRVTEGDLDVAIPEAPNDELGSLVRSFNQMTQRLKLNALAIDQAQHDLTEALASSRQRQYVLESLLANLQTGVLLVDQSGSIRLINHALRLILQPAETWAPGAKLPEVCDSRLAKVADFHLQLASLEEGHLQQEFEVEVGQQRQVHILARGARLSTSGTTGFSGYLIVMDDISELAKAQRNQAWAEVAKRLAHEIKNPLTPIKLAAERLQRRFRNQASDTEVFDACTHAIVGQVERLQRLIVDFTTLARMPQPRIVDSPVASLMKEMRELYNAYPTIKVAMPTDQMHCPCDPDQIKQILINLLDNGLAATANGGNVRLYAAETDDMIELHVEDEGEGIDQDAVTHLFEAYYSTKENGSGLGLSIAKRIAEDHGGTLQLISPASPTHFCLRLPKQAPSMEQP